MNKIKIPGISFSWKRALGITQLKHKLSRKIGILMTKNGMELKISKNILNILLNKLVDRTHI